MNGVFMSKYVKVMFGTTSGANKEFEYKWC